MTVVKICGFLITALNGVYESSLIESSFTADEGKNLRLIKTFEITTDINLFLGFADLTVGLFFWLI